MSEKILVTGGAGFIGSNVVDRLVAGGFKVVVVDDLSTGRQKNLNPGAKFYRADIRSGEEMAKIIEGEKPDYINHHAAQIDVRKSIENPGFDASSNIIGSINLIDAASRAGVKKFVYISTGGAVYGEPEELPASEECPVRPISAYGISKHTVEHYLHLYNCNNGLNYTVLRYANVYGPRQDPLGEAGVVAIFIEKMLEGSEPVIFGSGEQTRDYVFVEDVVEANVLALSGGEGGIYNIGTGVETSVNEIFRNLSEFLGFQGRPVHEKPRRGEVERIALDNSLALRELGWEVKNSLREGLEKTVACYRQNR